MAVAASPCCVCGRPPTTRGVEAPCPSRETGRGIAPRGSQLRHGHRLAREPQPREPRVPPGIACCRATSRCPPGASPVAPPQPQRQEPQGQERHTNCRHTHCCQNGGRHGWSRKKFIIVCFLVVPLPCF